ncbi:hypothetical protein HDU93_009531 [Gonapodya sp. JEL0774]|nr:hypothetical protein HDU93_009531 [Gonapodya sp. JEL0774]
MRWQLAFIVVVYCNVFLVYAQLTGPVGPTTSISQKTRICNVADYGAKADNVTDIGSAIWSAFSNCVLKSPGATLYVPAGNYVMSTWVSLNNGYKWAFQLDGVISRQGTGGGNMLIIQGGSDFEMFSGNRMGAFQGNGVYYHSQGKGIYGPRILRLVQITNFSLHDIAFFDSPAFHIVLGETVAPPLAFAIEINEMSVPSKTLAQINNNCHVRNIEVTNRDECVCVKSPSSNLLIEDIFCNWSGGMSMVCLVVEASLFAVGLFGDRILCDFIPINNPIQGSFNRSTAVENIIMRNVVSYYSTQFLMIKTYPNGDGYVRNCRFENFTGKTNYYALQITQYWQNSGANLARDLSGVQLSNLVFTNWVGLSNDANVRAPVYLQCSNPNPCVNITITPDVLFWDPTNALTASTCQSAYGSGTPCLPSGSTPSPPTAYASKTVSVRTAPDGWTAPRVPQGALTQGFALTDPIPVEPLPFAPLNGTVWVDPPSATGPSQTKTSGAVGRAAGLGWERERGCRSWRVVVGSPVLRSAVAGVLVSVVVGVLW